VLPKGLELTATVYAVYRRRNAGVLERLLAPALAAGWAARLWALDERDPALDGLTAGVGPGTKFELVNRLVGEAPPEPGARVVVADDDAQFVRGSLVSFVGKAASAGLGLAQPAHVLWSNISHRITWMRPLSAVRLTTFVEIGPIFAVAPAWRDRVLPFPDDVGMGWGLELQWMDLREDGCRLGIVDATPIRHLSPFATAYAPDEEIAKLTRLLEERGAPGWHGLRKTLATWRPWRSQAPWLGQEPASSRS
jgi:hypothetical protein